MNITTDVQWIVLCFKQRKQKTTPLQAGSYIDNE